MLISTFPISSETLYFRITTSFGLIRIRCDGSSRALFRSTRIAMELPQGNSRMMMTSDAGQAC